MPKRKPTSRTCSTVTKNTRRGSCAALIAALVFSAFPIAAGAAPASLDTVLQARSAALRTLHVHAPHTLEISGTISGVGLEGSFHSWNAPDRDRYDQWLGPRFQSIVRNGKKQYASDENGNVRALHGLMAQRERTENFIAEDGFVSQPQYDRFLGERKLPDGRLAYEIVATPPGGLPETIYLDATTSMIDRLSFEDDDGISTSDYYGYHVFDGALVAQREIDSNGDHPYDLERWARRVAVNRPIEDSVFALPSNTEIQTPAAVTVPLEEHQHHYYTSVRIHGHTFKFLVDTGAQAIVLDTRAAAQLGLKARGHLEVAGAQRTGGMGMADLDALQIGSATLPLHTVSILDLQNVPGLYDADGVLGYPFFASAEVTFDAAAGKMTFGKPGSLHAPGTPLSVDVDRELVELNGKVNGVTGRFVVDTGNSGELLLFSPFMNAHPGLLPPNEERSGGSYGVGGSVDALSAIVDELDLGSYRFFNRYANVILAQHGAFADRFDAGNVGIGILRNLVVTFDLANSTIYASQSSAFDDGRFRARTEAVTIPY